MSNNIETNNDIRPLCPEGSASLEDNHEQNQAKLAEIAKQTVDQIARLKIANELATRIKHNLKKRRHLLRENQIRSLEKLINFLQQGKLEGLIKQPPAAGKTRLIGEILAAISEPSLVLVPKTPLVGQTKNALVGGSKKYPEGVGYRSNEVITIDPYSKTSSELLQEVLNQIEVCDDNSRQVIIMTYQSLLSIASADEQLLDKFMTNIRVIVSDEAHRSLGPKTQEVIKDIREKNTTYLEDTDLDTEEIQEQQEENAATALMNRYKDKLHLRTTATPQLLFKSVQKAYGIETIDQITIEDMIHTNNLILPQQKIVGIASYVYQGPDIYINDALLSRLAEEEKYHMENGRPVAEELVEQYKKLKDKCDGYLPGVAICATIAHAEAVKNYLNSQGVRTIRCTGNSVDGKYKKGGSVEEAEEMIERNELDMVVTVKKASEGVDIPTWRCLLWFTPTQSPARELQAVGRIMRTLPEDKHVGQEPKSTQNTFVIMPTWMVARVSTSIKDKYVNKDMPFYHRSEERKETKVERPLYKQESFYQRLVRLGEVSVETIENIVGDGLEGVYEYAPADWKNKYDLAKTTGKHPYRIHQAAEDYRQAYPTDFGYCLDNDGKLREYYSPELAAKIEEEVKTPGHAPKEWKTKTVFAAQLGFTSSELVEGRAKKWVKDNPQWIKKFKHPTASGTYEYYSPELMEKIQEDIDNHLTVPHGWLTAAEAEELGISRIVLEVLSLKHSIDHPEDTQYYISRSGKEILHYSPILIEKIKNKMNNIVAPDSLWIPIVSLPKELKTTTGNCHALIKKHHQENPHLFDFWLDKEGHWQEYYSPKLLQIIKKDGFTPEYAPKGWLPENMLHKELKIRTKTIRGLISICLKDNPNWARKCVDEKGTERTYYSPKLIQKVKEMWGLSCDAETDNNEND